jgi:hypothetical protein
VIGLPEGAGAGSARRILVAAPVRDRAWVLPTHLQSLLEMTRPADVQLDFLYIVNDCRDATSAVLERFRDAVAGRHRVEIRHFGAPAPAAATRTTADRSALYGYLAALRNETLRGALDGGYDYLLSIDTDIVPPPDALVNLLAARRPVAAALVCNDRFHDLPEAFRTHNALVVDPTLRAPDGGPVYVHLRRIPAGSLVPVDVTGAAMLVERRVLEAGCRFADHPMGEDVPFCQAVREKGFGLWVHSGVRCQHLMGVEELCLTSAQRAAALAPRSGTLWVNMLPSNRGVVREVTLAPRATARLLVGLFARELAHLRPELAGCPLEDFEWEPQSGVLRLRLGPEAQAAAAAGGPAVTGQAASRAGVGATGGAARRGRRRRN